MPTINVYYQDAGQERELRILSQELRGFSAKLLTCGDRALKPTEISVRLIKVTGELIGDVELEVHAHAFAERVAKQDEICLQLRRFMKDRLSAGDVRVWLMLSELGHSWEA